MTRTGEWSPVCRRCEWLGDSAEAVVGARFVGHDRRVWLANQVPGQARRSERDARANLQMSLARLKELAER